MTCGNNTVMSDLHCHVLQTRSYHLLPLTQALASTLSTAQDPLAAGLVLRALLPALWECPRAGMRKSLLDCAGACFGGGEAPTELASYAAAALSQGVRGMNGLVCSVF